MAKGFKHGAHGAAALNFKVVGGTEQPANPKENTIWVNTETDISGWVFSPEEPESPAEGLVWIEVGSVSPAPFNVLRKNGVYVYPVSCKQYSSEAWNDVFAYICQGGVWVQFSEIVTDVYLYNLGDTCDAVTGGWVSNAKALDSSSTGAAAPSITYGADSMTISTTGTNYTAGVARPANKIDVTNFNTIYFKGAANATTGRCKICVWSDFGAYQTDNLAASVDLQTKTEAQIDVSGLTGKYYIGFGMSRGSSKDNSVTVKQFYLA